MTTPTMPPAPPIPLVPAGFFGMVLGFGGLGTAWKAASRVWGYPAAVGEVLMLIAAALWVLWIGLYAAKWVYARNAARAELDDPILGYALGLVPMASLLAAVALKPYAPGFGVALMAASIVGGVILTAWLTGNLWQGGRKLETITPLTILPAVGTSYTGAIAAGAYGYTEIASILWGPGFITWLMFGSIILFRLVTHGLPVPMRASIGIELAPPAVGCLAYLSFASGPPDQMVKILLGYALLQLVILIRLLPWTRAQPFSPGAWAFTFGVAALSASTLICIERDPNTVIGVLAWPAFLFANAFIGWIAIRTGRLALLGSLFPKPQPPR